MGKILSRQLEPKVAAWGRVRARYDRNRAFRRGDATLEIAKLISPVRYDVVVRANYFAFLSEHLDLFHDDFERYTELAMRHPYYEWFRTIAHPRFVAGQDLDEAYRERLRKAARLFVSFQQHGFDPEFPILVSSSGPKATTSTGKVLAGRVFPVDGCHRLALLYLTGQRELGPESYRLRVDPRWSPPDNTHTLVRALGLQPFEYYRFVSQGYVSGSDVFEDEASLLAHLRAIGDDETVAEIQKVIAIDRLAFRSE